jgi:hypothetical protein
VRALEKAEAYIHLVLDHDTSQQVLPLSNLDDFFKQTSTDLILDLGNSMQN